MQYASVIHSSGTDLLRLLNDILDLAKVESGTVTLAGLASCRWSSSGTRSSAISPRRDAEGRGLLASSSRPALPPTIATDPGRLRQVLKNLLSNAFKFTEQRRGARATSAGRRAAGARRTRRSAGRPR